MSPQQIDLEIEIPQYASISMKLAGLIPFLNLFSVGQPGFRRNLFTLISGTTLAQVIGLALLPALTRIYSPEAFGHFGVFYATVCVLGVLATGRLELAVILPRDSTEARTIWKVALFALIAATTAFALVLYPLLYAWNDDKIATKELWLAVIIGLFLIGFAEVLMQWHNRMQQYGVLATKNILERITVVLGSFAFAYFGWELSGLIWAQIVALICCCLYMLLRAYPDSPLKQKIEIRQIPEVLKSYKDFPLMQGWSMLFIIGATQVPNILFGLFYSMTDTGHVNLAYRIIEAPVNLFAVSFSTTFYQHISQLDGAEIERLFRKSMTTLAKWLFPAFLVGGIISPSLFPWLFGDDWQLAGAIAAPLALMSFTKILYLSHSVILLVLRRLDLDLKISAGFLGTQLIGFFVAKEFTDSVFLIVLTMSLLSVGSFIFGCSIIFREIRLSERHNSLAGANLRT